MTSRLPNASSTSRGGDLRPRAERATRMTGDSRAQDRTSGARSR